MRISLTGLQGLALALACISGYAQTGESPSGIFSCTDAKGRKLTSDRPIPECVDREQKMLNPSGTVRAKVGPTLTAQERAEAEARERQEVEARALQAEEKRRERALLVRYPSREVHDKERAEVLAQVAVVIKAAKQRVEELQQDRRKLDEEMEFYKKDPSRAPSSIRRQIEDISQSTAVQKRFIADQDNEVRRINVRFDDELVPLKQLWLTQSRGKPAAASPKKAP